MWDEVGVLKDTVKGVYLSLQRTLGVRNPKVCTHIRDKSQEHKARGLAVEIL
jgi:hypothetical protein